MDTFQERKSDIVTRLDASRALLHRAADGLTSEQLAVQVQPDGERWNVQQMLSHLWDSERGITGQIKRIAAGQEGVPADFDLNRWNKRSIEKMADKPITDVMTGLAETRAALKTVIDGLSEADLDKIGRHGSMNMMTIEAMLLLISAHETLHVTEIAQALA